MKITKSRLTRIIKKELSSVLKEARFLALSSKANPVRSLAGSVDSDNDGSIDPGELRGLADKLEVPGQPKEMSQIEKVVYAAHQLFKSLSPEAKPFLIENFKKYIEVWEQDEGEEGYADKDYDSGDDLLGPDEIASYTCPQLEEVMRQKQEAGAGPEEIIQLKQLMRKKGCWGI